MRSVRRVSIVLAFLAASVTAETASADSVQCPLPADSAMYMQYETQQDLDHSRSFYPFRPGPLNSFRYRDLEFQADSLFLMNPDVHSNWATTLIKFGASLVDSSGFNPFGIPRSDLNVVYDFFRRTPNAYNITDVRDSSALYIGHDVDTYNKADRSHLDAYIATEGLMNSDLGSGIDGVYNSYVYSPREDISTGHSVDDYQQRNGIILRGPPIGSALDTGGSGWTAPDRRYGIRLIHEFRHALEHPLGIGSFFDEFMSGGAEAVAGNRDIGARNDVPYTFPLLGDSRVCNGTNFCTASNYQARSAFAAYLAYHFQNQDTSATIAGLADDLLHRWIRHDPPKWSTLRSMLSNDSCYTCANKYYLSVTQDTVTRLGIVMHNWRVATFVNSPTVRTTDGRIEGQFGYGAPRSQYTFSPAKQLGAWQDIDGVASDNVVAIPPEVTLSRAQISRETTFVGNRTLAGTTYPMILQPYGAEYWVVRSGADLAAQGQELVVRITPEGIGRYYRIPWAYTCQQTDHTSFLTDGRLYVSVVGYSEQAVSGQPDSLWKHPEWAKVATYPIWVDVDSLAGPIEIAVPNFGDSIKAAVVVLSLMDGPAQLITTVGNVYLPMRVLPYRLSLGVRTGPYLSTNPVPLQTGASTSDDEPAWSPSGTDLLFTRTEDSGLHQIYRRPLSQGNATPILQEARHQSHPDWSPRGDYIAFARNRVNSSDQDLWVYRLPDTTDLRQLTSSTSRNIWPAFQPNGQRLAYVRSNAVGDTVELRRIDLSGLNDTRLVRRGGGTTLKSPRWSPDGQYVFFTSSDTMYSVGVNGGAVVARTSAVPKATTFDLPVGSGRAVLEEPGLANYYYECGFSGTVQLGGGWPYRRVALRDTASGDVQSRFFVRGASFYSPRLSFDGTKVAYATNQNDTSERDLYYGQITPNHGPYVSNEAILDDRTVYAHAAVNLTVSAGDVDGGTVSFAAVYLPDSATFNTSGVFSWPNPKKAGADSVFYIVFRVLDQAGGVWHRVTRMTVVPEPPGGGGCPFADVQTESGWLTGNSILGRSLSGDLSFDAYRLPFTPRVRDGKVTVRIRENEEEVTTLDQANLLAVDHPPGLTVVGSGSSVVVGSRIPAYHVTTAKGEDITEQVNGTMGGWWGSPGDTVLVTMTAPRVGFAATATQDEGGGMLGGDPKEQDLRYSPGAPISSATSTGEASVAADARILTQTGVIVQRQDGEGGWADIGRWYPRAYSDQSYYPGLNRGTVRLIFVGQHRLTFVGRLSVVGDGVSLHTLAPASAGHSRLGAVEATIGQGDGQSTTLANGDTITMAFNAPMLGQGLERDYVLVTKGVYTTPAKAAKLGPNGKPLPIAFALRQNIPNPFRGTTSIGFDLPRTADVRIEIYDLLGRRVRTLVSGMWPAGRHTMEWNQRDSEGRILPSGVYLYRMATDSFRAQRKLIVLSQ